MIDQDSPFDAEKTRDMTTKTVFVTGCAGYVGSMVTQELLNRGLRVRGYDSLNFGGKSLLGVWSHPNFEFVKGDVRDSQHLKSSMEGAGAVVHLAAIVGDPACARDPELTKDVNLNASMRLLDNVEELKIPRLVFASTCSNYGKMEDPSVFVDESSELRPVSLYAETKVAVEEAILNRQADSSGTFTCLRFATVYGVSPRMRFDLTVNQFAMEMVKLKKLLVFGEQFWRPYIHVRDMANGVASVLTAEESLVRGEVFNVGATEENYTKQMIVDIIDQEIPGGTVEYVRKDEDPRDYRVTFSKIERVLGFSVTRTLVDGVREVRDLMASGIVADPNAAEYSN